MNNKSCMALALIFISFVLVTITFGVIFLVIKGTSCNREFSGAAAGCSVEGARQAAESFIRRSSTFKFDGVDESIALLKEEPLGNSGDWKLTYEYKTRHPGHGTRTFQTLAQVVTDHKAELTVKNCTVTTAICDGAWDMVLDGPLQREK